MTGARRITEHFAATPPKVIVDFYRSYGTRGPVVAPCMCCKSTVTTVWWGKEIHMISCAFCELYTQYNTKQMLQFVMEKNLGWDSGELMLLYTANN